MDREYPDLGAIPNKGRLRVCLSLVKRESLRGKTLVDVGCSIGWLAYKLKEEKLKKYIGIDSDKRAVEVARSSLEGIQFILAGASELPLGDNLADLLTMFDVIEHVPKAKEADALKEANRVLKKGGKLILSTPRSHWLMNILDVAWYLGHRHYKPEIIKKLLGAAGFKIVRLTVQGGIWFSVYLLWLYTVKWIFKKPMPRNRFLEDKDDRQFSQQGVHTIFVIAEKFRDL